MTPLTDREIIIERSRILFGRTALACFALVGLMILIFPPTPEPIKAAPSPIAAPRPSLVATPPPFVPSPNLDDLVEPEPYNPNPTRSI